MISSFATVLCEQICLNSHKYYFHTPFILQEVYDTKSIQRLQALLILLLSLLYLFLVKMFQQPQLNLRRKKPLPKIRLTPSLVFSRGNYCSRQTNWAPQDYILYDSLPQFLELDNYVTISLFRRLGQIQLYKLSNICFDIEKNKDYKYSDYYILITVVDLFYRKRCICYISLERLTFFLSVIFSDYFQYCFYYNNFKSVFYLKLFYLSNLIFMDKTKFRTFIIVLFIVFTFILIINQDIFRTPMDITIDFTDQKHHKISQLADFPYLRSITFVLPFFSQFKSGFADLYEYISYLNDKPLVKLFIKPTGQQIKSKYKTVALGGTFDHLHIGHQILLMHAALSAQKKLIIGITGQKMLNKKVNKQIIQSELMRINQVRQFIKTFKPLLELSFPILQDPYGPTTIQNDIDALIVSPQTFKTGDVINQIRKQKGFHELQVQTIPILGPVRHLTSIKQIENKVSSTQIRSHILAKNGLTIQQFIHYHGIWKQMIERINKIIGLQQKDNHLISSKWWDIVVKYYSQYWRYYHTNHHIATMFKQLAEHGEMGFSKLNETDKIVVQISIFFHDIIYRPDLKTNQEDSAHFAQSFINQIWKGEQQTKKQVISKVKEAIMATQKHKPHNQAQQIVCQLDMSILDSPLQKYKTYAFNIERQYRPLHKQNYPKLRVQFLQSISGDVYKYKWLKGQNVASNIKWQIQHWSQQFC